MDYKNYRAKERRTFGAAMVAAIIALFALLGWMGERDRAHMAEIEFQRQVINGLVSICPVMSGDLPVIEMGMPIGGIES